MSTEGAARAHLLAQDDILAKVGPMLEMGPNWGDYPAEPEKRDEYAEFKATEETGRPMGSEMFVEKLEVSWAGLSSRKSVGEREKREG